MHDDEREVTVTVPGKLSWNKRVISQRRRFNVIAKGRRGGGTTLAVRFAIKALLRGESVGWFSATFDLLAEAERAIIRRILPIMRKANASEHRYEVVTGGVLELQSLKTEISARGRKYHLAIIDEAAFVDDMRDKWEQQIRPSLADYQGSAWFVSSPNGMNYFRRLWEYGQDPDKADWASWQLPTWENPRIKPEEIESARSECDESNFRQEWGAEFVIRSGAVFKDFSRERHASSQVPVDHNLPILMGVDFGYRTFAAVFFQVVNQQTVHVIADVEYREMDTDAAIMGIHALPLGNGKPFWQCIDTIGCDPAGDSRVSAAPKGRTDVDAMKSAFPQARVVYSTNSLHRNPEWRASSIRSLLLNARGDVRLFVDPSCKRVIRMFENSVYPEHKEGRPEGQEPTKDGVNDHIRDALGYGLVNAGIFGRVGATAGALSWR